MPLILKENINEYLSIATWKIEEEEEVLISLLDSKHIPEEISIIKSPLKRCQTLAGRLLVKLLVTDAFDSFNGIKKDENGKPHLKKSSHFISISHTGNLAVAALNTAYKTGIDIERVSNRILKIMPKFLSARERLHVDDDVPEATIYWCAKEALYKLNGRKGVILSQELLINKERNSSDFKGYIINQDKIKEVSLHTFRKDDIIFVYSSVVKNREEPTSNQNAIIKS
ncbi:MAG: 4'-phosphopantetheinyl transferase superfamily protein [Bacteroidota bacterium]